MSDTRQDLTPEAADLALRAAPDEALYQARQIEDWVRLPVSIPDLRNRLQRLRRDARDRPARPVLDGDGRLVYRGRWISLSRRQEELAATLVAHFEQPVTTRDLCARTRDQPSNNALRCCIYELRRQVRHLGLDITSIRNHGYLLHA